MTNTTAVVRKRPASASATCRTTTRSFVEGGSRSCGKPQPTKWTTTRATTGHVNIARRRDSLNNPSSRAYKGRGNGRVGWLLMTANAVIGRLTSTRPTYGSGRQTKGCGSTDTRKSDGTIHAARSRYTTTHFLYLNLR